MTRARVPCRLSYHFHCKACGAESDVDLRLQAGDPILPPQHYLPAGWHIFDGHPVCPRHTMVLEDAPS